MFPENTNGYFIDSLKVFGNVVVVLRWPDYELAQPLNCPRDIFQPAETLFDIMDKFIVLVGLQYGIHYGIQVFCQQLQQTRSQLFPCYRGFI